LAVAILKIDPNSKSNNEDDNEDNDINEEHRPTLWFLTAM